MLLVAGATGPGGRLPALARDDGQVTAFEEEKVEGLNEWRR